MAGVTAEGSALSAVCIVHIPVVKELHNVILCHLCPSLTCGCAQAPGQDKKLWGTETDADTQLDADKLAQALDKARRAVEQQLEHDDRYAAFAAASTACCAALLPLLSCAEVRGVCCICTLLLCAAACVHDKVHAAP